MLPAHIYPVSTTIPPQAGFPSPQLKSLAFPIKSFLVKLLFIYAKSKTDFSAVNCVGLKGTWRKGAFSRWMGADWGRPAGDWTTCPLSRLPAGHLTQVGCQSSGLRSSTLPLLPPGWSQNSSNNDQLCVAFSGGLERLGDVTPKAGSEWISRQKESKEGRVKEAEGPSVF